MTSMEQDAGDAVNALLAEQRQYKEWLAALEARRAVTPAHIFARVQADYGARLQRVAEQLGAHRTAVEGMIESLTDRLTSLDIDDMKLRDEREETALRALVGELTEEQRAEVVSRTEAAAARLDEERAATQAEVARLRQALGDDQEASVPGAAAGGESAARAARDSAAALPQAPAAAPAAPASPGAAGAASALEQIWLGDDEAAAPAAEPATSEGAGFDELAFLKSVVDSGGRAGAPRGAPAAPAGDTERAPGASGTAAPVGAEVRESVPSFLRDVPAEQVKTLKCQECGTLNYPTEWYCERCGAELAAL